MKKQTKLFTSSLVLGLFLVLSISIVAANGPPYDFKIQGQGVVLTGEYFDIDDETFRLTGNDLDVYLDGDWYYVEEGDYALLTGTPMQVQIEADHVCDPMAYTCNGSGLGGN